MAKRLIAIIFLITLCINCFAQGIITRNKPNYSVKSTPRASKIEKNQSYDIVEEFVKVSVINTIIVDTVSTPKLRLIYQLPYLKQYRWINIQLLKNTA